MDTASHCSTASALCPSTAPPVLYIRVGCLSKIGVLVIDLVPRPLPPPYKSHLGLMKEAHHFADGGQNEHENKGRKDLRQERIDRDSDQKELENMHKPEGIGTDCHDIQKKPEQ